jgi:thiol peroxidase
MHEMTAANMGEPTCWVKTKAGQKIELSGCPIARGQKAPDFTVLDNESRPVRLSDYAGKIVVIASVVSLDTSVCDRETRRFNEEASSLGDDVVILVVSMDLPATQKRWCGAAGVERVVTLSDHRDASFGQAFGLLIADQRLLARAVVVLDCEQVVRHQQVVEVLGDEPDYDTALSATRELLTSMVR